MSLRIGKVIAVAALSLGAMPAFAFTSIVGQRVYQLNENVFEVVPRGRSRTTDYWCSASEFARRALGAGWRDRVYIVRGYGPSVATGRRTAVQFTLYPDRAGVAPLPPGGIRTGLKPGDSMSISQANGFCEPMPRSF
ncbi:hypothetical protein ACFORG_20065 [Lutimaribacter marinistellae]|uniref:Uncharacterized protein n=1 Tax=Lutimaribacter marinistellae TaxID=1820329 RepID=A0ABV7TLJ2_9RHOB